MSILNSLQDYIAEYSKMDFKRVQVSEGDDGPVYRVLDDIATDLVGESPQSYALSPSGNNKTSADILGNKTYQNNYTFYAKEHAQNEVDRLDTHDFLEGFSEWLEDRSDSGDLPALPAPYAAQRLEMSNGMLFDIYEDGAGLYQVQIQLTLKKSIESEEI